MKWTLRAAALSTILTALAAGWLFANPSWAEDAGVDFWQVVDDQRRIAAAEKLAPVIERETDLALRRVAVRTEVVRDVIDGRVAFEDGARRFAELNRCQPGYLADYTRRRYPARTDEERAARQLIAFLRLTREPAAVSMAEQWESVLAGRD